MRPSGTDFCLGSGAAFGAMAVFGKLASGEGATVGTLLAFRFVLAAAVFWGLILAGGGAREVRALRRRDVGVGLALGGCGYASQAACYFAALKRIDAGQLSILLYTFPVMVAAAAGRSRPRAGQRPAAGRPRADLERARAHRRRHRSARAGPIGVALGLGAAVIYTAYILIGAGIVARVRPLMLAALVCTGAAISLSAGSTLLGELRAGALTAAGWGWLACLAVISTVASISFFFAGLRRAGATTASILATVEPLVTVVLAFLIFGETLGVMQLVGGALVLSGALVLHMRLAHRSQTPKPSAGTGVIQTIHAPNERRHESRGPGHRSQKARSP